MQNRIQVYLYVHRPQFRALRLKDFLEKKVKPCLEEVLKSPVRHEIIIMKDVLNVHRMTLEMVEFSNIVPS
jgi:hypothetical protein